MMIVLCAAVSGGLASASQWSDPITAVNSGVVVVEEQHNFKGCFFMRDGVWLECSSEQQVSEEQVTEAVTHSVEFTLNHYGWVSLFVEARCDEWFYRRAGTGLSRWDPEQQTWEPVTVGQHYLSIKNGELIDAGPNKDAGSLVCDAQPMPSTEVGTGRRDAHAVLLESGRYRLDLVSASRFGPVERVYVPSEIRAAVVWENAWHETSPTQSGPGVYVIAWRGEFVEVDTHGTGDWEDLSGKTGATQVAIGENGHVVTGLDSSAVVLVVGRSTLIKLGPLSHFDVFNETYIIRYPGITPKTNLKVGELEVRVDDRLREIDFSVTTPTCTCSVRGTHYRVTHQNDPLRTVVHVLEGTVAVKTLVGPPAQVDVTSGHHLVITEAGHTVGNGYPDVIATGPPPTAPPPASVPGSATGNQAATGLQLPVGANTAMQAHFDFTRPPVGTVVEDVSGNGLKAVLHGARWLGAKGVLFDRSEARVEIASSPLLHGSKALTLIVDATPLSLGNQEWQSILWKGNPPDCTRNCENREYSLWLNRNGALHFNSTPQSWVGRSQLYLDSKAGDFFEGGVVAAVIDTASNTMRFYVNGQEAAVRSYASDTIRTTEGPLILGDVPANSGDVAFHGLIRSLRIYGRALTPAEVQVITADIGTQRRRATASSAIRSTSDFWVPDDAVLRGRWASLVHMGSDAEFATLDWATLEDGVHISDGLLAVPGSTSIPLRGPTEAIYVHDGSPITASGLATVLDCMGPCGVGGLMEFVILGDGKELWRSGQIAQKDPAKRFSVSLSGVHELRLVATDGGNGNGQDWGAWLNLEVGR